MNKTIQNLDLIYRITVTRGENRHRGRFNSRIIVLLRFVLMKSVFILTSRGKTESRLQYQLDHSPESAPSVPRNDHRPKPDAANPSHTTQSSGPRSLSPNAGSQHPSQLPQTKGLMPPPRSLLVPETTSSSSQEFLSGSQADPAALQPPSSCCSDTQHHASNQNSSAGPTPASTPHLSGTPGADTSRGGVENGEEKEQPEPPSSSSRAASSPPPADRARSPSPQFAPLRLTDKPPAVCVQDDSPLR